MNGSNLFCRNFTGSPVSRVLGPLEAWRCNCLRPPSACVHQGHQHSATRERDHIAEKETAPAAGEAEAALRSAERVGRHHLLQSADPIKFCLRGGHFLLIRRPECPAPRISLIRRARGCGRPKFAAEPPLDVIDRIFGIAPVTHIKPAQGRDISGIPLKAINAAWAGSPGNSLVGMRRSLHPSFSGREQIIFGNERNQRAT